MAVISINYNEPNVSEYNSVTVTTFDGEFRFDSGDLVKDWYNGVKAMLNIVDDDEDEHWMNSSSVYHFWMDGGNKLYDDLLVKIKDGKPHFTKSIDNDGIPAILPKNSKMSFKEYKEYCTSD